MAKIPLRTFLKEIEGNIDRGEIDQAIAYAKNIIQSYPKQIDAYRLLGKSFLESQRFSEASDILQRVLSVIPDDFVSQIGMSIIREDEGNLDAAIWHMERAYEVQPFNPAVQDELRRLYGRRDGIEPPKIRLTRGALVRMYLRGELHPQAIAETRAALADDPQRYDLLVLLARLYILSNQKFEATEVCSTLISKLPYCLEANQILSEILPGTSRADDAKKFQQRIIALDPYSAFISPSSPTSDLVPDQAVMVEQFAWNPSAEESQTPEWTRTIGVQWEEPEEEALPDWINSIQADTSTNQAPLETTHEPQVEVGQEASETREALVGTVQDELVPDFMKEAGWTASDRTAEEIMASEEEAETIMPAEIPQWLQTIAPEQPVDTSAIEAEQRTDWLENILSEPAGINEQPIDESSPSTQDEDVIPSSLPAWFTDETPPVGEIPSEEPLENSVIMPDWTTTGEIIEPDQGAEPEWLSDILQKEALSTGKDTQIPDWLKELETNTAKETGSESSSTEWSPLYSEEPAIAANLDENPTEMSTTDLFSEEPVGLIEPMIIPDETNQILPTEMQIEHFPDWLKEFNEQDELSQAEKEPVTGFTQELPDGLGETPVQYIAQAEEVATADDKEKIQAEMPTPAIEMDDTDATMAWLESLAARQGADEATLITPPEQRSDTLPDWVRKEMEIDEVPAAEVIPDDLKETAPLSVESSDIFQPERLEAELPPEVFFTEIGQEVLTSDILEEDLAEKAEAVSIEKAEVTAQETPTTETIIGEATSLGEIAPETTAPDFSDIDAALAWLEGLAARQGADEATLTTTPDQRLETPPDWIKQEIESSQQEELTPSTDETPVIEPEMAIPDWLSEEFKSEILADLATEEITEEPAPIMAAPTMATPEEKIVELSTESTEVIENITNQVERQLFMEDEQQPGPIPEGEHIGEFAQSIPDWLETLEEEEPVQQETEPWTTDQPDDAEIVMPEVVKAENLTEWLSKEETIQVDEAAVSSPVEPIPDWLSALSEEEAETITSEPEPSVPVDEFRLAWEPEVELTQQTSIPEPPRPPSTSFNELQDALTRGNIDLALAGFDQMIRNGENLAETIQVLRDALYRFPVDISIWQSLGDAYSRNNQLQEALDAYTKAEELLR